MGKKKKNKSRPRQPPRPTPRRKRRIPVFIWWALVITALLVAGRYGGVLGKRLQSGEDTAQSPSFRRVEAYGGDPEDVYRELLDFYAARPPGAHNIRKSGHRIIYDDHEHIGGMEFVPDVLEAMDDVNIKSMILLGTPLCTLTLRPEDGFARFHENNLEILEMQKRHPDRFLAFPTLDPEDPDKLDKLKQYVAMGARGLKLYLGHGWSYRDRDTRQRKYVFHVMPVNDPRMEPVYDYCEEIGLPVDIHVNNQKFFDEFEPMLARHPDMIVICPHFMLLSRTDNHSLVKMVRLLDTYPNLYTNISFGRLNVVKPRNPSKPRSIPEGFCRFTERPDVYRAFMTKYRDRILFSADMVFTGGFKTADWIAEMFRGYIHFLEEQQFEHYMLPGRVLNGMYLDDETLEYIYSKNFLKLFPPGKDFRDKAGVPGPVAEALR